MLCWTVQSLFIVRPKTVVALRLAYEYCMNSAAYSSSGEVRLYLSVFLLGTLSSPPRWWSIQLQAFFCVVSSSLARFVHFIVRIITSY